MLYEFVDRPKKPRETTSPWIEPLLATGTNGKALVVPLEGQRPLRVQNKLRQLMRRHGLKFHYRVSGPNAIVCWAEQREQAKPTYELDATVRRYLQLDPAMRIHCQTEGCPRWSVVCEERQSPTSPTMSAPVFEYFCSLHFAARAKAIPPIA